MSKYTPVRPNQRLHIQADAYNAMLEAAKAHEQSKFNQHHDTTREDRQADIVRILNESGEDLDRFAILELTAPLISPADNLDEFQRRPAFRGGIPTADTGGRFAILMDAIPTGRIGRAWVSGACPVQIDVTDADHRYAEPASGQSDHLVSAETGPAEILWAAPGTGEKWALVRLGAAGGVEVEVEVFTGVTLTSTDLEFTVSRVWVHKVEEVAETIRIPLDSCDDEDG